MRCLAGCVVVRSVHCFTLAAAAPVAACIEAATGEIIDPETHVLHLRLAQMRRAILHAPDTRPHRTIVDCIRLHQAVALPDPTLFTSPVGLLLDQLREHSVALSPALWLTRPGFPPMHLLHSAWPHLRSVASDWCNADRAATAGLHLHCHQQQICFRSRKQLWHGCHRHLRRDRLLGRGTCQRRCLWPYFGLCLCYFY